MKIKLRHPRKLLTASIGVAAVSYVACGNEVVANLVIGPSDDAGTDTGSQLDVVANLVVIPPHPRPDGAQDDANADVDQMDSGSTDAPVGFPDIVGNLIAPPRDANSE